LWIDHLAVYAKSSCCDIFQDNKLRHVIVTAYNIYIYSSINAIPCTRDLRPVNTGSCKHAAEMWRMQKLIISFSLGGCTDTCFNYPYACSTWIYCSYYYYYYYQALQWPAHEVAWYIHKQWKFVHQSFKSFKCNHIDLREALPFPTLQIHPKTQNWEKTASRLLYSNRAFINIQP